MSIESSSGWAAGALLIHTLRSVEGCSGGAYGVVSCHAFSPVEYRAKGARRLVFVDAAVAIKYYSRGTGRVCSGGVTCAVKDSFCRVYRSFCVYAGYFLENSSGRVGGGFRRNIAFAVEGIS